MWAISPELFRFVFRFILKNVSQVIICIFHELSVPTRNPQATTLSTGTCMIINCIFEVTEITIIVNFTQFIRSLNSQCLMWSKSHYCKGIQARPQQMTSSTFDLWKIGIHVNSTTCMTSEPVVTVLLNNNTFHKRLPYLVALH